MGCGCGVSFRLWIENSSLGKFRYFVVYQKENHLWGVLWFIPTADLCPRLNESDYERSGQNKWRDDITSFKPTR
jgi:hypothetical protein